MKNKLSYLIFSIWAAVVLYYFNKNLPVNFSVITGYFSAFPAMFNLKGFIAYLLASAVDIFLAVFLLVVAYIIGRRIASPLKKELDTPGFFSVSAGAGFSVIAGFIFLLAAVGALYEVVVYTAFIILCVYALFELKRQPAGIRFQPKKYDLTEKILLAILFFTGLLNLFFALTPETFYDSLLYHLAVPQAYILNHAFTKLPYNLFAAFPQNGELLYLVGLILNGPITAKLINYLFGLLLTAGVYSFGKKYTGRTAGLLAALLFYTMPLAFANLVNTQVDGLLTFYIFLAFYMLVHACERGFTPVTLALSGLFAGFALGIKYSGIIFLPGLIVVFLYFLLRKKAQKKTFTALAVYFIFALIPIVPWLVKNYIFWGNPVYPYFTGNPEFARLLFDQAGSAISGINGLLLFPWTLTMSLPYASMNIGPAFLILLPFLFYRLIFKKKEKPFFSALIIAFTLALIFFLPVTRLVRFFLPGLLIFSLLISYTVIKYLKEAKDEYFRFSVVLVLAVIAINNIIWVSNINIRNIDPLSYASGKLTKEEYLSKARPSYPNPYFEALNYINKLENMPGKVLFIGEARTYYCIKPSIAGSVYDKTPLSEYIAGSKATEGGLKQVLQNEDISYALVNFGELLRNKSKYGPDPALAFVRSREFTSAFSPVLGTTTCSIYRLNQE